MSPKISFPVLAIIFTTSLFIPANAQENTTTDSVPPSVAVERAPSAAEIMRERISRAKAMLAVKNYPAAEYELKSIKKESTDLAVLRVVNVLLMHTYLEQSDYPEAQRLLKEVQESKGPDSGLDFLAVAGQVVNGAKEQTDRYKSLGLSVNDRNLPTVAVADIEGMRTTLEYVVDQSKLMTVDENLRSNAAALLESSSNARGTLARDAYDAKRWRDAVADAREQMIGSRSVILNAVNPAASEPKEADVAASRIPDESAAATTSGSESEKTVTFKPVLPEKKLSEKPAEGPNASLERRTLPISRNTEEAKKPVPNVEKKIVSQPKQDDQAVVGSKSNEEVLPTDRPVRVIRSAEKPAGSETNDRSDQPNVKSTIDRDDLAQSAGGRQETDGPLAVGSLIGYATRRVSPIYPRQARSLRLQGVVRVTILVDEDGSVSEINDADGPVMLTQAASDAIRKWKFRPFTRDGQPVKAVGFVSFNFNL